MDTPGFFEAAKKRVGEVAQLSLESSCVYLFVMSYVQLFDAGDDEILMKLLSSDKCKMNLYIIIIITTHNNKRCKRERETVNYKISSRN